MWQGTLRCSIIREHRHTASRHPRGWTLIETMITIAAGAILIGASLQAVASFQRQFSDQQLAVAQHQELRLALEVLEQELLLTSAEAIEMISPGELEFGANLHGYTTTVTVPAVTGQTTLSVADGRGWPGGKTVALCWFEFCERGILAKDGQTSVLTLTFPLPRSVPAGASASVSNRIKYYAKKDERGVLRFMRQVDGGAAVLVSPITSLRFSHWDANGQRTALPHRLKRVVVQIEVPNSRVSAEREFSLRG